MANLRNIKDRITSIKSTQKITRAMKMVATAKVKRAENAVKHSRPFTLELYSIFSWLYSEALKITDGNFTPVKVKTNIENYPKLLEKRETKNVGIMIFSSNKGLAGAYCANIVRYSINKIKEFKEKGYGVYVYFVGQKAATPIKNTQKELDFKIQKTYISVLDNINSSSAYALASDIADDYAEEKIDEIHIITTRYQNMMTYKVESWQLLPALRVDNEKLQMFRKKVLDEELNISHNVHKIEPLSEFLPDMKMVLSSIVPMYITNIIYQALLESQASELASRMTAMTAAVNNADDMINTLTIEYNKARQANITQEITEVISGSSAV